MRRPTRRSTESRNMMRPPARSGGRMGSIGSDGQCAVLVTACARFPTERASRPLPSVRRWLDFRPASQHADCLCDPSQSTVSTADLDIPMSSHRLARSPGRRSREPTRVGTPPFTSLRPLFHGVTVTTTPSIGCGPKCPTDAPANVTLMFEYCTAFPHRRLLQCSVGRRPRTYR